MELIAWCWMLTAFGLVFLLARMYILSLAVFIGSAVCFAIYFRNEKISQEDIVDKVKSAVRLYKAV